MLEHLSTAVVLLDESLCVLSINPAAEELFDVSVNQVRGSGLAALFPTGHVHARAIGRIQKSGQPVTERDLQIRLPGSRRIPVDCTVTPLEEESRVLIELVRLDHRKRITGEEHLVTQNESVRALLRGLAHEIRNPLGGLRGAAQLLERELAEPSLAEYTQVIIHEADRLQDLLRRMLGPRTLPNTTLVNVHEITERVYKLVRAHGLGSIMVERDYDPSIPGLRVDAELLIQATLNVVLNAVQALDGEGKIVLRTRVHRQSTIGARRYRLVVAIDVIDNGPGIPEELRDTIFYPMVTGRARGHRSGVVHRSVTGESACGSHRVPPRVGTNDLQHPSSAKEVGMSTGSTIWVVDDDASIRWVLERALVRIGIRVESFDSSAGLLDALLERRPDAVVTDIRMPGKDGLDVLEEISHRYPRLPVIVMTAYSDLESAVMAFRSGAFEYLPKPFDVDEAVRLVSKALGAPMTDDTDTDDLSTTLTGEMLGSSASMQEVFRAIGRLSLSNMTVLITGESGTGKELVARALHEHGPRAGASFIALNTAAIPKELLESELFGHERGAFTGAQALRHGRFEQADEGTLFLDEIGDMPADLQTRLLRVLAHGEFYRVGGHIPLRVDVRIIAATHQSLEIKVSEGSFREDLFHRLNVIRIRVPPLRERRDDVPILAKYFLTAAAAELGTSVKRLSGEAERFLAGLAWPGNVRQLENTCRWLTVMASATQIQVADLPSELRGFEPFGSEDDWLAVLGRTLDTRLAGAGERRLDDIIPLVEQLLMETALKHTDGKRQLAARLLGWGRNTLTRKLQKPYD